jgi:hypothetical protein
MPSMGTPGTLIAIVGPTATGKSALAVRLAQRLSGEVINADSRQVYRGMDIGTAKPSAERAAVRTTCTTSSRRTTVQPALPRSPTRRSATAGRGALPIVTDGSSQRTCGRCSSWQCARRPDPAFAPSWRRAPNARARGRGRGMGRSTRPSRADTLRRVFRASRSITHPGSRLSRTSPAAWRSMACRRACMPAIER